MKLLQGYYGTQLYRRTARGVELTEADRRFLSAVRPILEQVENLKINDGNKPQNKQQIRNRAFGAKRRSRDRSHNWLAEITSDSCRVSNAPSELPGH
jgi:DNA-binding transcriptional LysR family regulator